MPRAGRPTEATRIRLCGGEAIPYQRPNTAVWWARIKKPDGEWTRVSTGCTDEGAAIQRIIEIHSEFRFRHAHGLTESTKTFKEAAAELVRKLSDKADKGQRDARYVRNAKNYLERYPTAFFADTPIDQIGTKDIHAFIEWRERYWIDGPGAGEKQTITRKGETIERRTRHGSNAASGEWSWLRTTTGKT